MIFSKDFCLCIRYETNLMLLLKQLRMLGIAKAVVRPGRWQLTIELPKDLGEEWITEKRFEFIRNYEERGGLVMGLEIKYNPETEKIEMWG